MGINYSAVSAAYDCLEKYRLQYVEKLPTPGPESGDLHFGSAVHAALQAHFEGGDAADVFSVYWDSLKDLPIAYGRLDWRGLSDSGHALVSRFVRLHARHVEPVSIETRLYGELGGHPVEGTPDLVGSYKGIPSIIDFKTSQAAYPKEKIIVNEQMPLYWHLAKQQLGYTAHQLVYFVFCKVERRIQVLRRPVSEATLLPMLANVESMVQDLKTRTVFPKNRNSCMKGMYKCPYFQTCYTEVDSGTDDL